jgi:hypothetical protein
MAALSKTEIFALSTQERLALVDDLWESIETPFNESNATSATPAARTPEWQRQILDERQLDLEVFPGDDLRLAAARSQPLL